MIAATSTADTPSASPPISSVLVQEAELWMGAQSDLLTGIEEMVTGWIGRQRQAFESFSRSMQRICDARNVFDVVQVQHEWVSDCLNWTASEIRAVGGDATTISRRATEALRERQERPQAQPPAETESSMPLHQEAAE